MPEIKDSKLARLENLLKAVDDTVTKEEFVQSFQLVMKVVKEIKETNLKEFEMIHDFMSRFQGKLQNDTSMTLAEMKKQVDGLFVSERMKKMEDRHTEMMSDMEAKMNAKMASMKDGKTPKKGVDYRDGKDADEEMMMKKMMDEMKPMHETMMKEMKDEMKLEVARKVPQRVMTPAKSYQIRKVDLTSQCNGVNKTFNVGGTHFGIMGVFGTQFPLIYRPIIDYTETATGFLLTSAVSAPDTGQTLVCQFLK